MRPGTIFLVLICAGAAAASAQPAADDVQREWETIGVSRLRPLLAEFAVHFEPHVTGKRSVMPPFPCNLRDGLTDWPIEVRIHALLTEVLSQRGSTLVDPARFMAKFKSGKDRRRRSRGPRVRFTAPRIKLAARLTTAEVVIVGKCRFGKTKSLVTLTAYGEASLRRLISKSVSIPNAELAYLANTPPMNRKIIGWVEQRLGKKIDRGECWDVANRAFLECGLSGPTSSSRLEWGRPVPSGQAVFPGDIVQWTRKESGRQHTAVVQTALPGGRLRVLHQNWRQRDDPGRYITVKVFEPAELAGTRVYRPPAAKAAPKRAEPK